MVKKSIPIGFPEQLRLAEEIALLRFRTSKPNMHSPIYTPWRIIRKMFDIKEVHMRRLLKWL